MAHLSREAIDEIVLLDVFPTPKKFVRMAAVIAHGVDPRLQDHARLLVKRLGDLGPKAREEAETQLFELGPSPFPSLEDALREKDIEIVFRAERILLRLNRQVALTWADRPADASLASSGESRPSWSRSRRSNCSRVPRNSRGETSPSRLRSILRNQIGPTARLERGGAEVTPRETPRRGRPRAVRGGRKGRHGQE